MSRFAISNLSSLLVLVFASPAISDPVLDWNKNAGRAATAACIAPADDPLHESWLYAITHVAIHDAINAIERRSRPYAYDAIAGPGVSLEAAVAAAARYALVEGINRIPFPPACLAAGVASVEADYAAALAAIDNGPAKTAGIALGMASAAAVLALRLNDGSDTPLIVMDYPQGTAPGEYRFTPGFDFVFAPGWGEVTPFVLEHAAQFHPGSPYNVSSKKYAADFNEVKMLGGDGITTPSTRTPDQTEIARFWLESSPLSWNRLARSVSEGQALDVWENARLFGLLNLALADGYIGSWEAKYRINFWRPVTAIHLAASDGNDGTAADMTWTPLQLTYPLPDYDSAHSVEGGAAAGVLEQFFGTDAIGFEACSQTLPPGSRCGEAMVRYRSYATFSQAAQENALSRIYAGIHFRDAVEQGVKHGRAIARRAVNLFLKPVR